MSRAAYRHFWPRSSRVGARVVCGVLIALTTGGAGAAGPFDVDGRAPEWAVVTIGEDLGFRPEPTSPMLDLIAGVVRRLDRKQVVGLRASGAGTGTRVEDPPENAARWCVVHLGSVAPGIVPPAKRVEIMRSDEGGWYAREIGGGADGSGGGTRNRTLKLDGDKFADLASDWAMYRGEFKVDGALTAGKASVLPPPYSPGWVTMTKPALGRRFLNGRATSIDGATRVLSEEKILVRLPARWTPRERCGVFVWVDAGPVAAIHECFRAAADELRLVVIGAEKTGNGVHASNRYQLALDVAQTAQERFLIDPARVYIGGISGGGRISTQMWGCFPDIFTGAVPVVGLDCYESVPAGNRMIHRAGYSKPAGAMWRLLLGHRIAPMTGPPDFNFAEITKFAGVYERDKLSVRIFEYPDMAHQLPTSGRFLDAIRWVDEPVRTREESAREVALAEIQDLPDGEPGTADWRARRVVLTAADPWSPAAWTAAEELGATKRPE